MPFFLDIHYPFKSILSSVEHYFKMTKFLVLLVLMQFIGFASAFTVSSFTGKLSTPNAASTTHLHLKDENMTPEERQIAIEKATKAMTAFSNTYIKNSNTKYCSDLSIPAVVIKGLAEHKVTLGAPLCPCRFYEDKEKEAKDGFWNCPCVPMRERHECHCMLFLTEDNAFAGEETVMSVDQVVELSGGM